MRLTINLTLALGISLCSQTAFADEALRQKITDAAQSCSANEGITTANASTKIVNCEAAKITLNALYAASTADKFDKNWFAFNAGAVMILLSGSYVVENNNKLNAKACQNALGADSIWASIDAAPGSKLEKDITNDPLFDTLVPLCKKAFKTK